MKTVQRLGFVANAVVRSVAGEYPVASFSSARTVYASVRVDVEGVGDAAGLSASFLTSPDRAPKVGDPIELRIEYEAPPDAQ